jgi:1,4-alpha-glucan branching enzyme
VTLNQNGALRVPSSSSIPPKPSRPARRAEPSRPAGEPRPKPPRAATAGELPRARKVALQPPAPPAQPQLPGVAPAALQALADGRHKEPHQVLGPHPVEQGGRLGTAIRGLFPESDQVTLVFSPPKLGGAQQRLAMRRLHPGGVFEAVVPFTQVDYHFEVTQRHAKTVRQVQDPYRFPSTVPDLDLHLFREGTLEQVASFLGANEHQQDGVRGYRFVVWAPNADGVSVVGEFNDWDWKRLPMRQVGQCVWELFVPGLEHGDRYKFSVLPKGSHHRKEKLDPAAKWIDLRPSTAARLRGPSSFQWGDQGWLEARAKLDFKTAPLSAYEVHLPSFKRGPDGEFLNYRELADLLLEVQRTRGFTHVELFGLLEHALDMSWGYQVTGYFAPTSRHGSPEDFKHLVDTLHQAGIGVLFDWVPGHFPKLDQVPGFDPALDHGLANFDGTHLFEHRGHKGEHPDWGTHIYNYGRHEVRSFLVGGLLHMLEEYHLDGQRTDAVASMVYLDYSRKHGQWEANPKDCGYPRNWNLEAIRFLQQANDAVHRAAPGALCIAEESTAFPKVTGPSAQGGLGFDLKWNMGQAHDVEQFFRTDPAFRAKGLDRLTNTFTWAHAERYVIPWTHDEVVYGKKSMRSKMPGDEWQQFANLRLRMAFDFAYPGHKLLFMGSEFGQKAEWNFEGELDWAAEQTELGGGAARLYRDLNRLYRTEPALHERQFEPGGLFNYPTDRKNAVVASLRRGRNDADDVLFVHNFLPKAHHGYRIGVSHPGTYAELLNTDAGSYGGSNVGNQGQVKARFVPEEERHQSHGKPYLLELTLPPLATLALKRQPT